MSKTPSFESKPNFEEDLKKLEEIVRALEREDLPLETLLDKFENGVVLLKKCQQTLKDARLRVEQYVEERDGEWILKEVE